MAKKIMVLIFSFLTLLSYSSARAQVNPVYKRMVQNGWSYPFKNGFRMLTPTELDSEFVKSMGYSESTVANLEKSGIRIVGRWEKRGPWNSKLWTALSDCIVIGTVSRIEHPAWSRPLYLSIVYVKVDSFLRNDYGFSMSEVEVMQRAGPTGTGLIAIAPNEPRWTVGERVLLYLSASQLITFAANNDMPKLYNRLINSRKIRFQLIARLEIKSGKIISKTGKESLKHVTDSVCYILDLINHSVTIRKEL